MPRFHQILRGTRARKTVAVEMPEGEPLRCDVRALNGLEQADMLAKARAFAEAKHIKDPRDGEPIYELGKQVHTLLVACLDVDSPVDKPVPFFASAEEVLELDRDRRCYLFELQEAWEDWCAPRPSKASDSDFIKWATEICSADEGDDSPFLRLRPVLRWTFVRTLALLHVISPRPKFEPGTNSEGATPPDMTASQATETPPTKAD